MQRLFLVTGSSFQPSQSLNLYPLLVSHPLILPELLHCSIPPAAQAFVSESVHEGGDLAFQQLFRSSWHSDYILPTVNLMAVMETFVSKIKFSEKAVSTFVA